MPVQLKRQGQRYRAKIDTFYVGQSGGKRSSIIAFLYISSSAIYRDSFVFTFQWLRCSRFIRQFCSNGRIVTWDQPNEVFDGLIGSFPLYP